MMINLVGFGNGSAPPPASFRSTMAESAPTATVLIIDDDSEIRYSLQRVLSGRPFRVLAAASGEEGLKVAVK